MDPTSNDSQTVATLKDRQAKNSSYAVTYPLLKQSDEVTDASSMSKPLPKGSIISGQTAFQRSSVSRGRQRPDGHLFPTKKKSVCLGTNQGNQDCFM